jgi:hypothetical protein
MLVKLIRERTSAEDCNAGIVFDNLQCEHWKDEREIIEVICDALQEENINLVLLTLNKDEDGLEYCVNYRYKKRKEFIDDTIDKEALNRTMNETKDRTEKKSSKRGAKRKEPTEEEKKKMEEEKKKAEEEERLRILKEEEDKKRFDDPEPKELEEEEKEAYAKLYEDILELFTQITLKQMNQKTPEHEGEGEGEGDEEKPPEEPEKPADESKKEFDEEVKEGEGEGDEKEPEASQYYGSRVLLETPMQYNFRYL